MTDRTDDRHLSAELMQAFLDREVSAQEAAQVEEHTASCVRCRSELDAWRTLFEGLGDLADVAPSKAFAQKVLGAVVAPKPQPVPFRERAARWMGRRARVASGEGFASGGSLPLFGFGHLREEDFQVLLDGDLSVAQWTRMQAHLRECDHCRGSADGFRSVAAAISALPMLAPSEDFGERVMAHVRVQLAVQSARPQLRELIQEVRASGKTRRRVAALAGASVTPAVTLALVAYVVLSHPLASLGNLASFLWLVASRRVDGVVGSVQNAPNGVFSKTYELIAGLVSSPTSAVVSVLGLAALTFAATWVLYRNVILTPAREGSYAR